MGLCILILKSDRLINMVGDMSYVLFDFIDIVYIKNAKDEKIR